MCVVFGHPEMTMMQAQKFSKLTRSYKIPNDRYHFYREDLLELLKPMADTYPDTRIYSTMCSIELLRGGNRTKALRYALQGLERPTRPRGYELALIQAGRMLPDGDDALNAFQLAFQLLTQPFLLPGQSDRFPFATKRRLAYRLQALDNLAEALWFRAVHVVGGEGSRRFLQFRTEVLEARHSLKPECIKAGLINKNGEAIYKSAMTLDEMLFELLDPEVVLEEERNTAYHGGSLTLLHQKGHTSGLQSLLQAFDTAGQTQTSVRSLQVDTMEQTDELNMGSISEEDYEEIAQSPPPTHTPDLHSVEQFQTTVRSLDVDGMEETAEFDMESTSKEDYEGLAQSAPPRHTPGHQSLLQSFDTSGPLRTSVLSLGADATEGTEEFNVGNISTELYEGIMPSPQRQASECYRAR